MDHKLCYVKFVTLWSLIIMTNGGVVLAQEEIKRGKTSHGIEVLVAPDNRLPLVHVSAFFKLGSLWDPAGKEGLAYLTAELLLRGTKTRTYEQIVEDLDQLGSSLGVAADHEYVTLMGTVHVKNLDRFMEILADVLIHPAFSKEEMEKLRRKILADLDEMRQDDRSLANKFFRNFQFGSHPYGRDVHGTTVSLAQLKHKDVVQFYEDHFRTGNLILAASGSIGLKTWLKLNKKYLKEFPGGDEEEFSYPSYPATEGRRALLVDKPERTQTQILMGHFGIAPSDPDYYPLVVAETAFGGMFTARLMKEIRTKRGWSYGAYMNLGERKFKDLLAMWVFPATKDTLNTIKVTLNLYEDLVKNGLTSEEVDSAKKHLVSQFPFRMETSAKKMGEMVRMEIFDLPEDYLEKYVQRIEEVTLDKVNEVITQYMDPKNLSITMVCSASEFKDKLAQEIPTIKQITVKSYQED